MTPIAGGGLTVEVLNTELAVGMERTAFRVADTQGVPIGPGATIDTEFYRLIEGSEEAILASSGPAQYFGAGTPGGGSWVVYAPFDASGEWGFGLKAREPGKDELQGRLNVQVAAHPRAPREGQMPPSGESPVSDDPATVTSDPAPVPEFYSMSVGQAMESGRPTVVHFGSPGHCETDACVAAMAALKAAWASYQGRVNFIHVETHDLADPSAPSATAAAWGIPSEPWTFVLDARGRIKARAEGALDQTELGLLLDRELGVSAP
jgi:hypothetical protein